MTDGVVKVCGFSFPVPGVFALLVAVCSFSDVVAVLSECVALEVAGVFFLVAGVLRAVEEGPARGVRLVCLLPGVG